MVSVIIVTYNRAHFLAKCLSSIINQTYKDIEIIVVDDGSNDNTAGIVKGIQDKRVLYFNEGRSGNLSMLRNRGIEVAKGEWIAFCDDDDLWSSEKLQFQIDHLGIDNIICSNGKIIDEIGNTLFEHVNNFKGDFYIDLPLLLKSNCILTSSVLARKDLLKEVGMFDLGCKNRSEDYALWIRIVQKCRIKYLNQNLISYCVHGKNLSIESYFDRIELLHRNYEIIKPFQNSLDLKIHDAAKQGIVSIFGQLARYNYFDGNFSDSWKYCLKLLKLYPRRISVKYFKYLCFFIYISVIKFFKKDK